jgi:hypothetical protein
MDKQKNRGQGIVELAVFLPVLLLLMIGVAEVGHGMRNYLLLVNADREGCRFAARGRFSDQRIAERVVSSGGVVRRGGEDVPQLRTHVTDPNTGIIITHIPISGTGGIGPITTWVTGVLPAEGGGVRPVDPAGGIGQLSPDSAISLTRVASRHGPTTADINAMREAADYEPLDNNVVIVETFFMHRLLLNNPIIPLPDPLLMHAKTEMRVVTDRD